MTPRCPLSQELLSRLLQEEVAEVERQDLRHHLETDCPECERFFSNLDPAEEELLLRHCLAREGERRQEPTLSPEKRRELLAVVAGPMKAPEAAELHDLTPHIKKRNHRRSQVLALAAGLLLAVALFILARPPQPLKQEQATYVKGQEEKPNRVSIMFTVLKHDSPPGQPPILVRGVDHATYDSRDQLLFRYELENPAYVYLVRLDSSGKGEVLLPAGGEPDLRRPAGVHDLKEGDDLFAYPLTRLRGSQTFCLATSDHRPLPPKELLAQVSLLLTPETKSDMVSPHKITSLDCFQIEVQGSWEKTANGR